MKIDVLSLFPSMFDGVFGESILKKAQEKNAVELNVVNFREYSTNKHQNVDDYPYGGGAGMVLTPQPIFDAVEKLTETAKKPRVVLLCPQGERYTQAKAEELAAEEHLIFICGHYEGYDERIREQLVTDEISIGDYVLTGGELGAMVVIDSVVRLLPDVLGNNHSAVQDSHSTGLLEHPHYTRPADFRGLTVPEVLMSGNHKKIEQWRQKESLKRTLLRRPDMLEKMELTEEQKKVVAQLKEENNLS
ncbi:tRNA (guanosine(37)-N1)-methyltransferase TrmD [Priestia sp. YIM B13446]|uniref:tRNA (guanosine(37)-N1)-methyltransferase TrmD n=1 Tax=Priestia TaxID=2800373 RepID=UPI00048D85EB|nr:MULTISPECIES: tRNA (guanosine(37)-N1)-methyltransferase TrmD [Priestia]RCX27312.1 tRNA (guanine37-N(1)-) methyltransferase [Bacillus sp. AG236]KWU62041.1 tRNA (guanine-N1)-methyltransferase [Priestia megaterium]MBX9995905.1 tRNA (guanosine(37)-N1)-methyltransferase TrmD [Priestia aryabhattai]MCM3153246.1 tRNA (guanosine(37)-N1)-methyltransferase TrmD [Priestia megaterium]MCP1448369.1 tRNA (guanine37-N1)-methyltransferase [Priestia megaterium]